MKSNISLAEYSVIVDGIVFDSKKEARHYENLKIMKDLGDIKFFLRQVPFDLPGSIICRISFMVIWQNGEIEFHETTGFRTKVSLNKIKQVEAIYDIKIVEF